jgi:MFS family permease
MIGSTVCYLVAGLCPGVVLPFVACILTGLFTAMLWPGALIFMEDNIPAAGVTAYALMAAGGDMGASLAPQLLGIVVDSVSVSPAAAELGFRLGISAEQVGLKAGMLVTAVFPLIGTLLLLWTIRWFKRAAE